MNLSFTKKPGPTPHAIHSDRQYYHNHKRFWGDDRYCQDGTIPAALPHTRQNPFCLHEPIKQSDCIFIPIKREQPHKRTKQMIQHSLKPEITGTRTGYVIRFTCPVCRTENTIINKTPRDHFRDTRDATCKQCRKRCTVLTPGTNDTPALSHVQSYFECTKLQ